MRSVTAIGGRLDELGLGPGARVAVVAGLGPEPGVAALGVASYATCVPVNRLAPAELDDLLEETNARALFAPEGATVAEREAAERRGIPLIDGFGSEPASHDATPSAPAPPGHARRRRARAAHVRYDQQCQACARDAPPAHRARRRGPPPDGPEAGRPLPRAYAALLRPRPLHRPAHPAADRGEHDPPGSVRPGDVPALPSLALPHLVHGRPDPAAGDPGLAAGAAGRDRRPSACGSRAAPTGPCPRT